MNLYLKNFLDSKFNKPGNALDLGAGDFFDVACLKQLGWKCEGVDIKKGTDLEKPYISKTGPFDLVYSNYLLHKLQNKKQLVETAYDNLKNGGWLFIHTFDKSDTNSKSSVDADFLKQILSEQCFKNTSTKVFDFYDNEDGHKHWHKILEVTAQK